MLVVLVALACGAGAWFWRSQFVPVLRDGRVEYVFLSAPAAVLIVSMLAALAIVAAVHVLVSRRLAGTPAVRWTGRDVAYLKPLALVAFPLIALVNLIPGSYGRLFAWTYAAVDFRPWLMSLIVIAFATQVDSRTGGALAARCRLAAAWLSDRDHRWEAALVIAAAAFVWLSAPVTRFDAALSGDEPKYMRYCENWYQGRGMELSGIQTLADLPVNFSPPVWRNLALFAEAVPADARALGADLGRLRAGGIHQTFNRAKYLGNWFLLGKDGGVYQIHTPGVSLLLFPAYFIDRYLLNWTYHYPQTPLELLATNAMAFGLYLAYAVLIFRFVRDVGGRPALAALIAFACVASLPVANFPFQFYPEVAAGICIVIVTRYVLFGDRQNGVTAALAGAVGGYLPWLHVRFLSVAVLLLAGAILTRRASRRATAAFAFSWAAPVALMCLYAYHVTGSLLPTALYDSRGEVLEFGSIGPGLFGFVFDRSFGTLPQMPILLLALAGVVPLLRRRPFATAFCAALVVIAAATAASHDFMAAATTPGRYLVAIVPLAMIGVVGTAERFGASRLFHVAFGLLLALSLDMAWAYNEHHLKSMSTMADTSVSGWKLHLLFPDIHGREWHESGFTSGFLYLWVAICVLLIALPWIADRLRDATPRRQWSYATLLLVALCVIGATGTVAAAVSGRTFDSAYLEKPQAARLALLQASAAGDYWLAASSTGRRVRRDALAGDAFDGLTLTPSSATIRAGERVAFVGRPTAPDLSTFRSGTYEIDFGDGQGSGRRIIAGPLETGHEYRPGFYEATATLVSGGRTWVERSAVAVGLEKAGSDLATLVNLADVNGLPHDLSTVVGRPDACTIDRIEIAADRVCAMAGVPPDRDGTLWIAHRTSSGWQSSRHTLVRGDVIGTDGLRRDSVCFMPADVPSFGHFALFVVSATPLVRSDVFVTFWPTRDALLGSRVIAGPAADPFALPLTPVGARAPRLEWLESLSRGPSPPRHR